MRESFAVYSYDLCNPSHFTILGPYIRKVISKNRKVLVRKDQNHFYHFMCFMINLSFPMPVLEKLKQRVEWSTEHIIEGRSCFPIYIGG